MRVLNLGVTVGVTVGACPQLACHNVPGGLVVPARNRPEAPARPDPGSKVL